MKPHRFRRKCYVRLKSRQGRNGLGYDHFKAVWRHQEEIKFKRFERQANELLSRCDSLPLRLLRETDPEVFYQSPFLPKPHYDPDTFLPGRRYK